MATVSRGKRRTAPRQAMRHEQTPLPSTAEILAAVQKSRDLELITEAELLDAIDSTRVCGLMSEHEVDGVCWTLVEQAGPDGDQPVAAEREPVATTAEATGAAKVYEPTPEEIASQCERYRRERLALEGGYA